MSTTKLIAKAEENSKWVGRNYERLTTQYDEKWIAVSDRQVIDSDKDLKSLVSRLKKNLKEKYPEVAIEYIAKKPLNMVLVV